ncbi:aspartate/glutamate racemase family protein [Azospirillum griseum]|uniref:Aspartate/glutamate racemase family protein n=1 Tax=Azospirillum griseum TaxID=2496639 RepID=A0A3S0IBA5_9PROT|nr:aspartate/glutamate racemase family protein [Azospirillum griseum]RTR13068.1 aspartate/glutamate racemase family protein [Azospirillum griseum]
MTVPRDVLVVNPNTTASMTDRIGAAARAAAAPTTRVLAVNPSMGPASIEGYYDEALAVPGLLDTIIRHERAARDQGGALAGIVIACFDDVGLDAARCVADAPVVGICEAAMQTAGLLGGSMGVVTTLNRSVPALERLAQRYGVADRCTVRAAEVPVLALEDPASGALDRMRAVIARLLDEDGAECIVLGCAGMADLARSLRQEFGVPVVDGVSAAVTLVEGLATLGLRTSKRGGYAAPLPKAYTGVLAGFAP